MSHLYPARFRASTMPVIVSGIETTEVEGISLKNITINRLGKVPTVSLTPFHGKQRLISEATMFGPLPGHVMFCRNASGVRLDHIAAPTRTPNAGKDIVLVNCKSFERTVDRSGFEKN